MEHIILFRRFLKFSGMFNIIAAFPFMFPQLYKYYFEFYNIVNETLGLGGKLISPPTNPLPELLINTAGIDLVLIGVIVLLVSNSFQYSISRKIIIANGIGRLLFFFITIYYFINSELIHVFIVFGVIDLFITLTFFYLLYKTKCVNK